MRNVLVIGGGPAGIIAAIMAARSGAKVTLWERNKTLGRKLAITGKGRCNITNMADNRELINNTPGNGVFLFSALSQFSAQDTYDFFEDLGLSLKTERGRRVFPLSDKAQDVVETLVKELARSNVKVEYKTRAKKIALKNGKISGAYDYSGRLVNADRVVIATGGVTYPATGSSGDGYLLAHQAGHSIEATRPSLVPLETKETWPAQVSGLSLKNVQVSIYDQEQLLDSAFGEMLFTHFGISGPIVLSLSNIVTARDNQGQGLSVKIDLKPAISEEQLDDRLRRDMMAAARKHFCNSLDQLLPASLIPIFIELAGIDAHKPVNQLTRGERQRLLQLLKALPLTIKKTRPITEAIVTAGGVRIKEIDPKTMESKLVEGLYFSGEVIDINGFTGGYNLQAAWSSGYVAGSNAAL